MYSAPTDLIDKALLHIRLCVLCVIPHKGQDKTVRAELHVAPISLAERVCNAPRRLQTSASPMYASPLLKHSLGLSASASRYR